MRVVDGQTQPWEFVGGHREGDISFKKLLQGTEGTPDNFHLSLVRQTGTFFSPRHRHNFEQVRMTIKGQLSYADGKWIQPGEIGYFPEGTYYGPQNDSSQETIGLVYQGGGANGDGFMSQAQLTDGVARMKAAGLGTFEGGVFRRTAPDLAPGEKRNRDSFEAAFEFVMGKPVVYPAPRYDEPVLMRPANFAWNPTAESGVWRKSLGRYTEREFEITMLRLDAGASTTLGPRQGRIVGFVLDGEGKFDRAAAWSPWTSVSLDPGESRGLVASTATEMLLLGLPVFAAASPLRAVA